MQHMLLKAATSATTDQGEFTAIAAAYSVDRVKDRIIPGAFGATIKRWQESGKQIPLHWNHEGDPKSIIGSINPSKMKETDQGLYVEGKLDLADSEIAREAWRSMKNGAMSLSFGYIVDKSRKATAGVTDLLAIDLFEVSIVPAPANADTRVLSLKQMADAPPTQAQLRILNSMIGQAQEYIAADPDPEDASEMADIIDALEELRGEPDTEDPMDDEMPPPSKSAAELRKEAQRVAREAEQASLPDVPAPEPVTPEPEIDLVKELQEVKTRLAQTEQLLETLRKKADGTGDENSRRVDPLRKQAEALALEIASDGQSLRKPPKTVERKPPEPSLSLKELKQRTRDEMLGVLSGGTIHE